VEDVINAPEFWIVYFDSAREDLRSDSHQRVLVIGELVVPYAIIEMRGEEGIALERRGGMSSSRDAVTHPRPGFSERTEPPI